MHIPNFHHYVAKNKDAEQNHNSFYDNTYQYSMPKKGHKASVKRNKKALKKTLNRKRKTANRRKQNMK